MEIPLKKYMHIMSATISRNWLQMKQNCLF